MCDRRLIVLKFGGSVLRDETTLRGAVHEIYRWRRDGVVVVPGYVAQDDTGRPVVLGRGGSDLSALFLASRLGADRCRLVKDVDGLYEGDPAAPGPRPRRYAHATWTDALATDGSIVQHKAVRFARAHDVAFEIGRLQGSSPTRVGAERTTFGSPEVGSIEGSASYNAVGRRSA